MWLQSILVWVTMDDSVSNCKHSPAWETKVMNFSSWLIAPPWLYEKLSLLSWVLQWFSDRPKPTLQVTHCNCSLLFTVYKKEHGTAGVRWLNYHGDTRGCPISSLHGEWNSLFFLKDEIESCDLLLSCCGGLSLSREQSQITEESQVLTYEMFEAAAYSHFGSAKEAAIDERAVSASGY